MVNLGKYTNPMDPMEMCTMFRGFTCDVCVHLYTFVALDSGGVLVCGILLAIRKSREEISRRFTWVFLENEKNGTGRVFSSYKLYSSMDFCNQVRNHNHTHFQKKTEICE